MNSLARLFVPVTALTCLSILYLDRPVALLVKKFLYGNRHWSRLTSSLPDALLILVVSISIAAYCCHLYRKRRQLLDDYTQLLRLIALALPTAYVVKTLLKILFGRVTTRFWLQNQQLYEFHWLRGADNFNGFPSGHMIVFTTLFVAINRYFPSCRLPCLTLLGLLAVMLVATNYHFVGDVISGAYIGCLLVAGLDRFNRAGIAD